MAEPTFDPNVFYRITNPLIGSNYSLDVANTESPVPLGTVDVTPAGPFMGQLWQLLNLDSAGNSSTYLLSSYYLGAQKKLFLTIGQNAIYVPFLTNFSNSPYDLSWVISATDSSSPAVGNGTYSMIPHFLGGAQALSVNTVTKQPFLEVTSGGNSQQWQFTPVQYINDATFSAAALSAVGTSVHSTLFNLPPLILTSNETDRDNQPQHTRAHSSDNNGQHVSDKSIVLCGICQRLIRHIRPPWCSPRGHNSHPHSIIGRPHYIGHTIVLLAPQSSQKESRYQREKYQLPLPTNPHHTHIQRLSSATIK
jgi:hypothetical protein